LKRFAAVVRSRTVAARVMAWWVKSPKRIRCLIHVSTLSGITSNFVVCRYGSVFSVIATCFYYWKQLVP
jgi:hypothetical protein